MKLDDALSDLQYIKGLVAGGKIKPVWWYQGMVFLGAVVIIDCLSVILFTPKVTEMVWTCLNILTVLYFVVYTRRGTSAVSHPTLRQLNRLIWVLLFILIGIAILFVRPYTHYVATTYYAFEIGVIYLVSGLFVGKEILGIGAWVFCASAISLSFHGDVAHGLWLALSCGVGLIGYGLWLRFYKQDVVRG